MVFTSTQPHAGVGGMIWLYMSLMLRKMKVLSHLSSHCKKGRGDLLNDCCHYMPNNASTVEPCYNMKSDITWLDLGQSIFTQNGMKSTTDRWLISK